MAITARVDLVLERNQRERERGNSKLNKHEINQRKRRKIKKVNQKGDQKNQNRKKGES